MRLITLLLIFLSFFCLIAEEENEEVPSVAEEVPVPSFIDLNSVDMNQAPEKHEVVPGDTLWDMNEDDIKREMVTILLETEGNRIARQNATYDFGDEEQITLDTNDIIVEKRELHYGSKEKNPVLQMNFLEKKDFEDIEDLPIETLPLAGPPEKLPLNKPEHFIKRTIRFFSRDREKNERLGHAFQNWKLTKEEGYNELKMCFEEIDDEGESQSNPALLTQESATYSAVKRRKLDF